MPPTPDTERCMHSGQKSSPSLGTPIRCARAFTAREAITRAEAQPDDTDAELEPTDPRNHHKEPANPSGCPEAAPMARLTKNQKKNLKDRAVRRKERGPRGGSLKSCATGYRESAKRSGINVSTDAQDFPHSRPGWIGIRGVETDRNVYGLEELQEKFGLRLISWDGK
jgi:hypothetical protein